MRTGVRKFNLPPEEGGIRDRIIIQGSTKSIAFISDKILMKCKKKKDQSLERCSEW